LVQTYLILIFVLFTHPPRSHKQIENALVSRKLQNIKGTISFKLRMCLSSDHAMLLFYIYNSWPFQYSFYICQKKKIFFLHELKP
jgi:hypothetical protein